MRQAPTRRDRPRQADSEYSLSIDDVLARYEAASIPRTSRSVQRYCAKGDLDAHRIETPFGEKFLITRASVDRHIAYIKEVRPVATGRDESRHTATELAPENTSDALEPEPATDPDEERQAATAEEVSRPVGAEARIVELLESENQFLREQIAVKDTQIAGQQERAHEMNALVNGLQRMLGPLLSAPDNRNGDTHGRDYREPDRG